MIHTRCMDHRKTPGLPRGCKVCRRLDVERRIIERVVRALIAAGYELNVSYGSGHELEKNTRDAATIFLALMECDDELLLAFRDDAVRWVRFVYGNDGYDVIEDYTTSLEDVLSPVNDYADSLDPNVPVHRGGAR